MARLVVFSTCGSSREACKIARELVRARVAACVNIVHATSFYRWNKKIRNESEWLLIIKTRSEVFAKLKAKILALHSYDVPEVVSLRIEGGLQSYLAWLDDEVR